MGVAVAAPGQDMAHNHIVRRQMLDSTGMNAVVTVTYYDGLGRRQEVVQCGATPDGLDLVSYTARDNAGRETHVYLPAVSASAGGFVPRDEAMRLAAETHLDAAPHTTTEYERSPLGRPVRQYEAGQAWRTAGRAVNTKYLINNSAADSLRCRLYRVSDTRSQDDTLVTVTRQGDYATGTLRALWRADEDGKATVTFTDLQGKEVLTRVICHDGGATVFLDTYKVYDDYDRLTAVLPPKASAGMTATGTAWSSAADDVVSGLCYLYMYDGRGRVKAKKLPGCGWQTFTRDKGGRVIYWQDGNLRGAGKRMVTLSDIMGRETLTGLVSEDGVEAVAGRQVTAWRDPGAPTMGVASNLDLARVDILSVKYYDDYGFISNFASAGADALEYVEMDGYDKRHVADVPALSARGLLTGTATRVTGDSVTLVRSLYYDHRGNVIQSHEAFPHLSPGISGGQSGCVEHTYSRLTLTGKPLRVMRVHTTADTTLTDVYSYTYDHMERQLTAAVSHDGGTERQLCVSAYDALGRPAARQLGGSASGLSGYAYNVRGWLTAVSGVHFSQTLHYQDTDGGATPCYNGNVSAMEWTARDALMAATPTGQRYSYSYDGMNRLVSADYEAAGALEWNGGLVAQNSRDYSCSYAYDLNGNITALTRRGVKYAVRPFDETVVRFGDIDDLTLSYDGNRLRKVTDRCTELTYEGAMDFRDGADKEAEYAYDPNGNMTRDRNKGIWKVSYNVLNLPREIIFEDGHIIRYTYAADGRKLRTEYVLSAMRVIDDDITNGHREGIGGASTLNLHTAGGGGIAPPALETTLMTRDYRGNLIYRDGQLERVLNDYGYMDADGGFHYHIKDWQGNVRAVIDEAGTLEEVNSYYPYGALMGTGTVSGGGSVQPYKYGGKELDRQAGLDWYDSQARMYDPLLGRTPTMDPKAEEYYNFSPYIWCKGNPVNRIDPSGLADYYNVKGVFIYHNGDDDAKYIVLSKKTKEKDIVLSVERGEYIPVPSSEVIETMDQLFGNSDNGSTIEQGFIVYQNNMAGNIQNGTENEIELKATSNKNYDVHIHQWNGPNGQTGEGVPSGGDMKLKEVNEDKSISVVLGYQKPSPPLSSSCQDPRLSTSAVSQLAPQANAPQWNKKEKQISFYAYNFILSLSYEEFRKSLSKIETH